jgi:hypothetical protein
MSGRPAVYERHCKNCGVLMKEPLAEDKKLWMFCSSKCRQNWNELRQMKRKKDEDQDWE